MLIAAVEEVGGFEKLKRFPVVTRIKELTTN